jgi:cyclopropane fatty-acyl-phospholipid synthase-like methyltransferase
LQSAIASKHSSPLSTTVQSDPANLARVRAYYDQTWWDYRAIWLGGRDRAMHFGYWCADTRNHADSLFRMNEVLADKVGIAAGDRVLDAGCGVGGSAMWLAQKRGARVVGITPVSSQVRRARCFARDRGLDGMVTFEQHDYLHTPYDDASFDVVWAQESVAHADQKDAFVAEAFRLLRPGGRLLIVDFFRWHRAYPVADERLLVDAIRDWAAPDFSTQQEMDRWAWDAGFVDVTWTDITEHMRHSWNRLYLIASLLYPLGVVLRALRLRTEVQHANLRGSINGWRALQRNLWHESILTARRPSSQPTRPIATATSLSR